jgi:acetoin utilization protein AcuA
MITATLETPKGIIQVDTRCRAEFLSRCHLAEGMGIFWNNRADLQMKALHRIAALPDGHVAAGYLGDGTIVAYVAILPAEPLSRWFGIRGVYELEGIEVSRLWRGMGVARRLVATIFCEDEWEDRIVMATAFRWCWDTEGLGLDYAGYRRILERIFAPAGFAVYPTDEPNIAHYTGNILGARVGRRASPDLRRAFMSRLYAYEPSGVHQG